MPDDRYRLPALGEIYDHLLQIDAELNGRSPAQQLLTLTYAKLQERTPLINRRVAYAAAVRGITFEQMWRILLSGEYEKLQSEDVGDIQPVEIPEWAKTTLGRQEDKLERLIHNLSNLIDEANGREHT